MSEEGSALGGAAALTGDAVTGVGSTISRTATGTSETIGGSIGGFFGELTQPFMLFWLALAAIIAFTLVMR